MISSDIRKLLQAALYAAGLPAVALERIHLEHPGDLLHGDYASNVALAFAKEAGQNPHALAEVLVEYLQAHKLDEIADVEIAGPGFINFHLAPEFFRTSIASLLEEGSAYGRNNREQGRRIIVEYAQPNPFKPFHIGHLMSTTLGESLSRLVEWSGAELFRANYQGDVGPHVAKCIWGLVKTGGDPHDVEALGEAYVVGNTAYENEPQAKEEIDVINKRIYEGDPALQGMYDAGRAASLARFEEIYKLLGTKFDAYFFESETGPVGKKIVEEGLASGIFEESEGAVVYKGEKQGLHTRVFITAKGIQTYEAKELGLVQNKLSRFPFDLNITTVAVEQDGYFKVVEAALAELWPEMRGRYTHVPHGLLQLTSGKMSSRKGNVITGESLIEDMREKAKEKMQGRELQDAEHVADQVAVGAIKYAVLKQGSGKDIMFDPEKSLSLEGDSGPYVQYAHTRALSVLEKAKTEGVTLKTEQALLKVTELERLLYRFPEVVAHAQEDREPHYIASYVTEVSAVFNSWYAQEKILDGTDGAPYKLALTQATAITLKNGLWLLGIASPERM